MWWPWVAEGEIPLKASKGQEISRYKELDPTKRLLLLKALCEVRADISCFRKEMVGGDGKGTTYWYDGNPIGHTLYRERVVLGPKTKAKGKGRLPLPIINFQWETLATNLEEFCKAMVEFSSSNLAAEASIGRAIETDAIPVIEKLLQKKERELKRKQMKERHVDDFKNSYRVGVTRSCCTRRPINYTYDDYDRAIKEAIQVTNKGKTTGKQRQGMLTVSERRNKTSPHRDSDRDIEDKSDLRDDPTYSDMLHEVDTDDSGSEDDDNGGRKDVDGVGSNLDNSEDDINHADGYSPKQMECIPRRQPRGERWSKRLAGASSDPVLETRYLGTKNRLRQRPTHNSALDSCCT
ncbi:DDT domain-containing protein DDR4 [Quillaja saponaria]|uniref:DDT domain-containing protein DDR4 n=1 Tax=Quillaja saponaria TaxID=32244 RepID=A0AAD7LIA0_QUISA|nr:DDT domain-containing protein DDR4 [Quillaja saponaria]